MELNKTETDVLLIVRKIQGQNNFAKLRKKKIASSINKSEKTVQRVFKSLEAKGYIFRKHIPGKTSCYSLVPKDTQVAKVIELALYRMEKPKYGQFKLVCNGENVPTERPKMKADTISAKLFYASELSLPKKKKCPDRKPKNVPTRQSLIDNLLKSAEASFITPPENIPKTKKQIEVENIKYIESYIFNFWEYLDKKFVYSYPRERKQIKRLLLVCTPNEICNRFLQLYRLTESDPFYSKWQLTPCGLSYFMISTLQTINKNSQEQLDRKPFKPIKRKLGKKTYSISQEYDSWCKGFPNYVTELRKLKAMKRKLEKIDSREF